ncbi:DUF350 domain-containing protein [Wolbachia endosymbiont (group B) of Ablattaria laevigata]|uniref:DUF350 domain-containing protein n=1 Tax=Wolbachia endosymbiont (group B) of Ablattaria laevigata TaxID=3077915 RepID=UPI00376F1341
MLGTLKKSRSNDLPYQIEELIQSLSNEEDRKLFTNIYKKVTKKRHNHENLKKEDGTIKKCIELFNNGADPNVLIQFEKLLREQEEYQKYYNYYTEKFLPALEKEVIESEELMKPSVLNNEEKSSQRSPTRRGKILGIILEITGITNKSSDKNHSSSTIQNQKSRKNNQTDRQDNAMGLFKKKSFPAEVPNSTSSDMTPQEEDSAGKGVSGIGISGTYNSLRSLDSYDASTVPTLKQSQAKKESAQSQLNGFSSQFCEDLENKNPSTTADPVEVPRGTNTSKLSSSSDLDSEMGSRELSKESLKSPVSKRKSSVNSAVENHDLQEVTKNLQIEEEEREVSFQHVMLESRKKENMDQVTQMTSNQKKDSVQFEKKEEKIVLNKQEADNYENNSKNKNLHVALVTSSALLAIGCIVAGAMTSGLVGAGLFVVAAVFATAAAAEFCSNILSSKLTSISVSPLVDNKELTR